jgi:hypothetical protein
MKHPEHELQKACVKWFRLQYPHYEKMLRASANGGKRNAREAARLRESGVTPGDPDLKLSVTRMELTPPRPGLYIEMKIGKNTLTPDQKIMLRDLKEQGYSVAVCRSIEEFIETIENYLS